jgi:hypothetical protein
MRNKTLLGGFLIGLAAIVATIREQEAKHIIL